MKLNRSNILITIVTCLGCSAISQAYQLPWMFPLLCGFITGFTFPILEAKKEEKDK